MLHWLQRRTIPNSAFSRTSLGAIPISTSACHGMPRPETSELPTALVELVTGRR